MALCRVQQCNFPFKFQSAATTACYCTGDPIPSCHAQQMLDYFTNVAEYTPPPANTTYTSSTAATASVMLSEAHSVLSGCMHTCMPACLPACLPALVPFTLAIW